MNIPPMVGLCSYEDAAQISYSVEDSVNRLVRCTWIEKCAMEMALYWMNSTPEWEVKEAFSLHLYQDSEHVAWMRKRVSEMRNPPPRMDVSPTESLEAFLQEVLWAEDTVERIVGLYSVLKPALLAAYKTSYENENPLAAHPTRRILRFIILEEEEAVAWGQSAIAALTIDAAARARADEWIKHLQAYLCAAGGIMGDQLPNGDPLPAPRRQGDYQPDFFPRRDDRFILQKSFLFPPHQVYRADGVSVEEKTLALMCKRTIEMDVPEVMARIIAEAKNKPWDFYTDMCRQLWDEARHAMMGTVYFEIHGIDWKSLIGTNPGWRIHLNQHLTSEEAHAVLYAIEQGLMPATTGKRYEWETADEAHDELATLFQDYDWADEVLHVHIGRRWLVDELGIGRDAVVALGHEKGAAGSMLEPYIDASKQVNWWPEFVRTALGKESTMEFPLPTV